jgi:hypothetical protein
MPFSEPQRDHVRTLLSSIDSAYLLRPREACKAHEYSNPVDGQDDQIGPAWILYRFPPGGITTPAGDGMDWLISSTAIERSRR